MVLEQLEELYREVILEHFQHSSHAGDLPGADRTAAGNNPLCGDELTVALKFADGRVERARFRATGCAISQAAVSMLLAQIEGKSRAEIARLIGALKTLMQDGMPDASVDLGDLEALAGVRKFPVRVKCAALSWNVLEEALKEDS